ncbi:NADH-quinone oxidoreductase subunit NuoN [Blochmannia endosymbiont of Camponotus sp. C-003]|uniref:NADH-quinone oxidoreductase subunit NuoN n=1 Tax=unclassified Candidatus Blochmanniella TaxID=711328 RepID=UPI0020249D4F|nr:MULTISPECIES: NADH-quinone oxidoreductase subunit NuoN [unclassified Candidatus Blochmannia]URJ23349.1 NADH-quinone oxidoreductase subunit NuoN [Blochmannia endosymbiont of Camponotus sp. C-003]URJ28822.1 NADH-quinone oxidoreductase subunit NuoN [Blochmannia endosymbiont of Camponotus sp. C-046]
MLINWTQIILLLPVLIIGTTTVIIMLSIAYRRNLFLHTVLTILGFSISMISIGLVWDQRVRNVLQLICVDNYSILYTILVLVSSLSSAVLAYKWLLNYPSNHRDEFYLLLLISSIGGILLTITNHLIILFLGIELISLPLFGLIGYSFFKKFSLEASIKYIILSGVSSSFILFGIALIYAATGFLSFTSISQLLRLHIITSNQPVLISSIGLGMMMVGFGFKLSLVPFHLWTPDVYQGAPSSISLYLTTSSKIAMIAVLTRLIMVFPDQYNQIFCIFLSSIACCSTLFGNLMAIKQDNIKRVLAYSSIAHTGYIFIGVIAVSQANPIALEMIGIYLISYVLTSIGAFGVISIMSFFYSKENANIDSLFVYRGLFWKNPVLSVLFTIIILSLAGIPMTLGFIGKFYLFVLGINSKLWWFTICIAMSNVISIFYYLRIIINLYRNPINRLNINSCSLFSWSVTPDGIIVIIVSFFILFLGLYPNPVIYLMDFMRLNGNILELY